MSTGTGADGLAPFRERIEAIDERLLAAVGERIAVCREVAEHKRANGIPMMQPDRVAAVRERWVRRGGAAGLSADFAGALCDAVVGEGCRVEDAIIEPAAPAAHRTEGASADGRSVLAATASGIDHVAIAVRDLDAAIVHYRDVLGFELRERRQIAGKISGMDSAVMEAGGVKFVLVQGDSPESNVSRYIEAYGPGVQHVALEIAAPEPVLEDLRRRDCDLLTGVIHSPGLDQVFTKREPNSGIQLELITRVDNDGFSQNNVQELFEAMERENVF